MTYLNCPRCRLSLHRRRHKDLGPDSCPRCLGRLGEIVPLFASPRPFRLLNGIDPDLEQAADGLAAGPPLDRAPRVEPPRPRAARTLPPA